ncbi:MAG: hypothetical protein M0R70_12970 [Nitrospirae bacterium]|nr:hypothetical protein [Nitrospirota bacterium]
MVETKLSSSVTIKQYRVFKAQKNTSRIADLILERFRERYVDPFENNNSKHGFSMIAIGCLMVEALHSFKKGWKRTGVKGGEAFDEFFSSSKHLNIFKGVGEQFYSNIRCGVLHQGETYDGWKITRKGELLDRNNKTVNATKFLKAIDLELQEYFAFLKSEPYDSDSWKKAIKKMDHICTNCNA